LDSWPNPDGGYKWICSRGKVLDRDSDGRAVRMIGTTTDMTALREMAADLLCRHLLAFYRVR
jgi:PAS domain-containing protein